MSLERVQYSYRHDVNEIEATILLKFRQLGIKSIKSTFLALTIIGKPWPGFGPGTFALPRQRSTG